MFSPARIFWEVWEVWKVSEVSEVKGFLRSLRFRSFGSFGSSFFFMFFLYGPSIRYVSFHVLCSSKLNATTKAKRLLCSVLYVQGYTVKLLSTKSGKVLVTRGESLEPARI